MTTARLPRQALSATNLEIVESVYRHRLLTTTQIHDLHGHNRTRRMIQIRLAMLCDYGYLTHSPGPQPAREFRWYLTGNAADLVEGLGTVDPRPFRMDAHRAAASRHLLAVNDVGVALTRAARTHGDEFGPTRWRHEVALSTGPGGVDNIIADAVATYDVWTADGVSSQWRFIELDRGRESVHALVAKIRGYRAYATYTPAKRSDQTHLPAKLWQRDYPVLPGVLFVFADVDPTKVARRIEALVGYVDADPYLKGLATDRLQVTATTLADLQRRGPHDEIFVSIPTLERGPLVRRQAVTT